MHTLISYLWIWFLLYIIAGITKIQLKDWKELSSAHTKSRRKLHTWVRITEFLTEVLKWLFVVSLVLDIVSVFAQ